MKDRDLKSERHPTSGRWAMLVDEGDSVWLYLTGPADYTIQSDCWVHNLVPAPLDLSGYDNREISPPATSEFVAPDSVQAAPGRDEIRFVWSDDGHSVAVFYENSLVGFIASDSQRGFSRYLTRSGAFGQPLDYERAKSLFGPSAGWPNPAFNPDPRKRGPVNFIR